MGRPDPYETLGVHKNSTLDQIRAAYRKLAIKTHPDKTGGDDTQFKKVADAYETLSDPNKRRMHDTGLPGGPNGFESFFGAFNRKYSGSPSPSQIPCDPFQVCIPLAAIVKGTKQRITVAMPHMCGECGGKGTSDESLLVTCPDCRGSGKIHQNLGGVFSIAIGQCRTCRGKGKVVPSAAQCKECGGEGVKHKSKSLDLDIPAGTPDGHTFVMENCGSYDTALQRNRHVKISVKWNIPDTVRVYDRDIHTSIQCTLKEVMRGFTKVVNIYGSDILISQDGYRNPSTPLVKESMGILGGDLVINLDVKWPDILDI